MGKKRERKSVSRVYVCMCVRERERAHVCARVDTCM